MLPMVSQPSPEDLADFLLIVGKKQIREAERFAQLLPLFTGPNALAPFESVVVQGAGPQELRAALAFGLSEWLGQQPNQSALVAAGVRLSPPQIRGVIEILRGELERRVIDEKYFNQDRKTVDAIRDRAARGMAKVLVAAEPGRFARAVDHPAPDTDSSDITIYMRALEDYCATLPRWFPPHLQFTEIQQEVLVTSPVDEVDDPRAGDRGGDIEHGHVLSTDPRADAGSRPLALVTALQRYQAVLLLGGPGSGKSWATKGRCLSLAAELQTGSSKTVPVLVIAARLEERLGAAIDASLVKLPRLLAESMPEEVVVRPGAVEFVTELLSTGSDVELLIDGYDEIGDERPQLARQLASIVGLLDRRSSRFAMTTRPSSIPQQRVARLMATLELQPFGDREQRAFVDIWFAHRPDRATQVKHWISTRRLDLLSTPLLIALLCTVTSRPDDLPPDSEPELMYRVLTRLASDEERFDEVDASGAIVRLRIKVLEQIAMSYVAPDRIVDSVSGSILEDTHCSSQEWLDLRQQTTKVTVLDDLAATGLIQMSLRGHDLEIKFLHSAIRDYLIARALKREDGWRDVVDRIWSQPEWEPAVAYTAAIVAEPDEVLLALERRFDRDPLNTARFVAGRALSLARNRLSPGRRRRTRDELLILLGSNDVIDRSRSAALLAAFQDDETATMVRGLINPAVPTRVVEAALRSVAGSSSDASLHVVASCAKDARFTVGERESAIEALAELATPQALGELEHIVADTATSATVRAAAAFVALRRLDAPAAAKALLATNDLESQDARWGLAERIGAQAHSVGEFVAGIADPANAIVDPYSRALIYSADVNSSADRTTLASAVPPNPALEMLTAAVEIARRAIREEPLAALAGRYILNEQEDPVWRWAVATRVHATDGRSALKMWSSLMEDMSPTARISVAEFLNKEAESAPAAVALELREAIEAGRLGALTLEEFQRRGRRSANQVDSPDGAAAAAAGFLELPPTTGSGNSSEPTLQTVLADPTVGGLTDYRLLRGLQRTLPSSGRLLDAAASLTHAIAGVGATWWIDAQPQVAGVLEGRLALSSHFEAGHELARLRAVWPDRQGEVPFTVESYHSDVLDSRALAALLEENWVEAASMALASIGARRARNYLPSEFGTRVLLAAGTKSGRLRDTFEQVRSFLPLFEQQGLEAVLLRAWLLTLAGTPGHVDQILRGFTPRTFSDEAESIALRCFAGTAKQDEFDGVISWSACRTVATFLAAIAQTRGEGPLHDRVVAMAEVAERRASALANRWPPPVPRSPALQGRPPWQRKLVAIAVSLLDKGLPSSAAAVFETVLEEFPNNAEIINNYGFTVAPLDHEMALAQLDRAADLFPRPFAVNVANRMLLRLHRGDYHQVLQIAETYRSLGVSESTGECWYLWDIDDVGVLRVVENIYRYIAEIAGRAAQAAGRPDLVARWQAWQEEMSIEPDDSDNDLVRDGVSEEGSASE